MIVSGIHLLLAVWLALYGAHALVLAVLYLRHRREGRPHPPPIAPTDLPPVTVQVPIYNERHVVERVIDSVAALDYPRDRLEIQILDDSDDETTRLARARAARHRERGVDVRVLRRPAREGFKAGALAWGLARARGTLVAIFDADFHPRPDFLRRTVPHFRADPALGMVQTRWSYLNDEYSPLTRAQRLALDGHFIVEQMGRSCAGLLMNFNGTGGVWRRDCIAEAGGWQPDTLSEDLDLSYRAQLAGWRCLYLPHVDSPAELPPQVAAFKRQQARWAQGSIQCLRKLAPALLHSSLTGTQKVMALLHLSNYLAHPLMIGLLLITLPLLLLPTAPQLRLGGLSLFCLAPPLVYALSERALHSDWPRRLRAFPLLTLIGMGIAWNNTRAVWRGLTRWGGTFARTPKFQLLGKEGSWRNSIYRLRVDPSVFGEVFLSLYALGTAVVAWRIGQRGLLPFLLLYAASFASVAGMELGQAILARRGRRSRPRWALRGPSRER
jgi:cellulose synthase/poly-beta-1,6-N-acetylglucosamine synthase-like glycosyltransferase